MELTIDEVLKRGVEAHQAGRIQEADGYYAAILKAQPNHPDANHNMGVLVASIGKVKESLPFFEIAVDENPGAVQYWLSYLDSLLNLNLFVQAKKVLYQAQANGGMGDQFEKLDRTIKNRQERLVILPSEHPSQHQLQPIIELYNRGEFQLTLNRILQLLKQFPKSATLHNLCGAGYAGIGQLDDAIHSYGQALKLKPDLAEAYNNLGNAHKEKGDIDGAIGFYTQAINIANDYADAFNNMGTALQELGNLDDAIEFYSRAIKIKPDYAVAHSNMGSVLDAKGDLNGAIDSCRKAISINPNHAVAYNNLGNALKDKGDLNGAIKSYRHALKLKSAFAEARQSYSLTLAYMADWGDVIMHSDLALSIRDDDAIWAGRLFSWIYHPDLSPENICSEYIRWGARFPEKHYAPNMEHERRFDRRLRIGYVSPDFYNHSCRHFFEPLFSCHDHTRFELFAYSNVQHEDRHTLRMKSYFDAWRDIRDVSDQEVFGVIRDDNIDILIDACGHMRDTRLSVFALKPAPIQVTWLGAAWTTGLSQMDYALFDPYMGQPDIETSEQVIRLPRTWAAYRPNDQANGTEVTVLPALKNGYVTFGYSGRTERLNYKVFRTWSRLLERITDARLIIDYRCFADTDTRAYFRDFMFGFGIDMDRVELRYSENIFEALGDVDILLDSFPHNGGTMLYDALWMGVPAISLAGRPPVGRIGESLMSNLGLSDWIAYDEASYVEKAALHSKDFAVLADLRAGMRDRMGASPVMDEKGFAMDVENAYTQMWSDYCVS